MGGQPGLEKALMELSESLHRESNRGNIPADLRNVIIHSVPTQEEIQLTIQLFESRKLWHRVSGQPRSFLHPSTHAVAVLGALGVADPLARYEQLVDAVYDDIGTWGREFPDVS